MDHEVAMASWISVFGIALCGLVAVGVVVIAVVAGVWMARRSAADPREMAELRRENERLRAEIERLKQGQTTAGSTDIKAG